MKSVLKRRLLQAGRNSLSGLRAAWRSEEALRIELILFLVLSPIALWIGKNAVEISLLLSSLLFVVVVELLNTGLEKSIDRISTEIHETSRFVKDVGSAAVAVALLQALITWGVILFMD